MNMRCPERLSIVLGRKRFWKFELLMDYLLLHSEATLGVRAPETDGVRVGRGAVKLRVSERGM